MRKIPLLLAGLSLLFTTVSCSEESKTGQDSPFLIIKLNVDPTQLRLGNAGNSADIPEGHAAQDPVFHKISSHYVEFAPNKWTQLGEGAVLYHGAEKDIEGTTVIDFSEAIVTAPGETYLKIPLQELPAGSYEWVRLSLSYQNYDVEYNYQGQSFSGTVASFVGFNTYIEDFKVKDETVAVNDTRLQGYWAFEHPYGVLDGQAPEGATTVPNPISETSAVPPGSCVVTGEFRTPLVITREETEDVVINMSLSVNKSFEWEDTNGNGKWDVDLGEKVVDMGLRGLIPMVE
ncbi:hypothetical protein SAMN04488034_101163 [Salinimicrobium catena]|uniref:DUF4382 domain-containing protein n=1 Tax=Salinimicrobium catena TaxID=390640 RepID=A0A1H5HHC9_9FLAO|nr:hypothetical protein [Salinimicrobium catena]SDK70181.1 hypothetical protein SAMN04488140_101163 [Salinimicrobium catena]SEE27403.1 hypothetical protein SAMN04488034_101163 [Salinimicrobium catena]